MNVVPPPFYRATEVNSQAINRDWLEWRAAQLNGGANAAKDSEPFKRAVDEAHATVLKHLPGMFEISTTECVAVSSSAGAAYHVRLKRH